MRTDLLKLAVIEALEQRRLLAADLAGGVLTVTGTDGNDMIAVASDGTNVYVNDNGTLYTFDQALVARVSMFGMAGNDTLQVVDDSGTFFVPVHSDGGAGDDFIDGAAGDDVLIGGDGNDYIFGYGGNDVVHAGAGNDFVAGMAGNDTLHGHDGDDMVFGGDDDDLISGGAGVDQLFGDGGNDDLFGGADADKMDGGEGADRYIDPDELDTMVMDGTDVVYVTPPPPPPPPPPPVEEPCDFPGKGHHYGHHKKGGCSPHGTTSATTTR